MISSILLFLNPSSMVSWHSEHWVGSVQHFLQKLCPQGLAVMGSSKTFKHFPHDKLTSRDCWAFFILAITSWIMGSLSSRAFKCFKDFWASSRFRSRINLAFSRSISSFWSSKYYAFDIKIQERWFAQICNNTKIDKFISKSKIFNNNKIYRMVHNNKTRTDHVKMKVLNV